LEQQQQRNQDGKSNDDVTVFLGIGTAFILVVIGGIFVWCICRKIRKKRKQKEDQLPKLNEPNDYDNVCGDQMAPKEYDVVSDDVLIEQGESNAGLEPSDYSQETSV
jgi:flagellar biosynthesis/type III secretory pathway M-ring protein FliF/YscJ